MSRCSSVALALRKKLEKKELELLYELQISSLSPGPSPQSTADVKMGPLSPAQSRTPHRRADVERRSPHAVHQPEALPQLSSVSQSAVLSPPPPSPLGRMTMQAANSLAADALRRRPHACSPQQPAPQSRFAGAQPSPSQQVVSPVSTTFDNVFIDAHGAVQDLEEHTTQAARAMDLLCDALGESRKAASAVLALDAGDDRSMGTTIPIPAAGARAPIALPLPARRGADLPGGDDGHLLRDDLQRLAESCLESIG